MRVLTLTRSIPSAREIALLFAMAAMLAVAPWAMAGQLGLGEPEISGDTVTVPIFLQADASGDVSTLDFRMRYDPSQLRPVGAQPGPAAQNADKDVMTNVRSPGEFSVILMGLNRNVMSDGQVASITFQRVGEQNAADLRITQTTFASPDGIEIPSRVSSRILNWDGSPSRSERPQDTSNQEQSGANQQQAGAGQPNGATAPGQTQAGQQPAAGGAGSVVPPGDGTWDSASQNGGRGQSGGEIVIGSEDGSGQGAPGSTAEVQRQLQGAIASADAARSGVGTPGTSQGATPGAVGTTATPQSDATGATAGAPAQGAPESGTATGDVVDATVRVAQARTLTDASRAVQHEGATGTAATGADLAPAQAAPTVPLIIAAGVALAAMLALFVVRKKLFA